MVKDRTEDGEFEGFVVFTTDDKVLGKLLPQVLDMLSGEFVFGLDGGKVCWPVLVYEKIDLV